MENAAVASRARVESGYVLAHELDAIVEVVIGLVASFCELAEAARQHAETSVVMSERLEVLAEGADKTVVSVAASHQQVEVLSRAAESCLLVANRFQLAE